MKTKDSIVRKIYFYRLERATEISPLLPGEMERLNNLPWDENGRYLVDGPTDRLAVWPDTLTYPLKIRLGRTRLSQLPVKEQSGKLTDIALDNNAGLAELIHVIIYENGFVAAEYNPDGPRLRRLAEYMFAKRLALAERPTFLPLFQKDVMALVGSMATIRLLELKGTPDAADLLKKADESLSAAFAALTYSGGTKTIELALTAQTGTSTIGKVGRQLTQLVADYPGRSRDTFLRAKLSGKRADGRSEVVDLLEDHLIATATIERQAKKSKAVATEAAYRAIDEAYQSRRAELQNAITGRQLEQ